MICLIFSSDGESCIGYLNTELITALIITIILFWGVYSVFKIILRLLGF